MTIVFDHAALAAPQRDPIKELVLDLFGGTIYVEQRGSMADVGFRGVQIDMGGTLLEVIEPTTPESFLHPFLAKRGPGLHHLTWYVADLDSFLADLGARGIPLTGVEHEGGRATNAFIRPSASFGALLQFRPLEDKGRGEKRGDSDWFNLPPPRPTIGSLVATSIAVPDGSVAQAWFHSVLGGETDGPTARGDAMVRTLTTGGTTLEFLSPADPAGLHALTFAVGDLAAFRDHATTLGIAVQIDGDEGRIDRGNPTGARYRIIEDA